MCDALKKAARIAKIKDDSCPGVSSDMLLLEWSKIISSDCDQRFQIACVAAMGATDPAGASFHTMLASMASDVKQMKDVKHSLVLELASHMATIPQQSVEIDALKAENSISEIVIVQECYHPECCF